MSKKLAFRLAELVQARANCLARDPANDEWAERHEGRALKLVRDMMPSGSGFDNGTTLDLDKSTGEKLVFSTAFHHMDSHGGYIGWTDHIVTVTPSLLFGYTLKVSGRNRRDIKDYIADSFSHNLDQEVTDE